MLSSYNLKNKQTIQISGLILQYCSATTLYRCLHNIMLDVRCWKTNLGFKRSSKRNLDTTITLRLQIVSLQYNIFHMILHYSFAFRSALWWISVSTKNKYNFKIYFIWATNNTHSRKRIIKPHAPHTAI